MKCFAVLVVAVIVTLATCGGIQSSVVPLTLGTAVLPPLSYTAQTVDVNGLQVGTVVAGQPARLVQVVAGPTLLTTDGLTTLQGTVVQVAGAPAAIQLATSVPAAVQLVPAAPVLASLVQGEG